MTRHGWVVATAAQLQVLSVAMIWRADPWQASLSPSSRGLANTPPSGSGRAERRKEDEVERPSNRRYLCSINSDAIGANSSHGIVQHGSTSCPSLGLGFFFGPGMT